MSEPVLDPPAEDPIFGFFRGKIEIVGDIVSPLDSDEELEEFFERSCAKLHDKFDS